MLAPMLAAFLLPHLASALVFVGHPWEPAGDASELANATQAAKYPEGWDPSSIRLCMEGKSLPVLYLLGAPKAGTTTMAADLGTYLGIEGVYGEKELHFFDNDSWTDSFSRQRWMDMLPGCHERGLIEADMTPDNMRLTPLPPGVTPYGTWNWLNVPQLLNQYYGGRLMQRLTFVVMLREPLSRLQSLFHMLCAKPNKDKFLAPPCTTTKGSFTEQLRWSLALATDTTHPSYDTYGLWASMYATQLASYLEIYQASQFAITPMKTYFKDPSTFLQEVAQLVGGMRPDFQVVGETHENERLSDYPALEFDIDPDVRVSYDKFMLQENAKLVSLLIKMHAEGAYLHGFPDNSPDEQGVGSWLAAGW